VANQERTKSTDNFPGSSQCLTPLGGESDL